MFVSIMSTLNMLDIIMNLTLQNFYLIKISS